MSECSTGIPPAEGRGFVMAGCAPRECEAGRSEVSA